MIVRLLLPALCLVAASPALAQQQPSPATEAPARTTMRIRLAQDDLRTVPITMPKGVILFQAQINGQDVQFLFDNGTDLTLLDDSFARQQGLPITPIAQTANTGLSHMPLGLTETTVAVGEAMTLTGQFRTADLSAISAALGTQVSGVLGYDAAAGLIVVVNPTAQWIAFELPGRLTLHAQAQVAKADAATREQHEALIRHHAGVTVPFGPGYVVQAQINGEPVSLKIDYGSGGTVSLREEVWERLIAPDRRSDVVGSSTRADGLSDRSRVGEAHFALDRMEADLQVTSAGALPGRYDGLLGSMILNYGLSVLNTPKRQLTLMPPGADYTVARTEP